MNRPPSRPLLLVHGGAGRRRLTKAQSACLAESIIVGYGLLQQGASAIVAVEHAIGLLEESGLFNAGRGSNRQLDGRQRMDASLMEGATLKAGAVASIQGIVHPIRAARLVMDKTDHVLLVGAPAGTFARHFSLEALPAGRPSRSGSYAAMLRKHGTVNRHGTVGAVALDHAGTVAAGASTGGIQAMLPGRVGDTPLVGCGVYADNRSGAVSMTGGGEGIIRLAVAKGICDRLEQGDSPSRAARHLLRRLISRIQGSAGTLVLGRDGRFAIEHVSPRMAAGWWNGRGQPVVRDRWQ